jgi:hypothetical protein
MKAIQFNNIKMTKYLLKQPNIDVKQKYKNKNLLYILCHNSYTDNTCKILKLLLKSNIDINDRYIYNTINYNIIPKSI